MFVKIRVVAGGNGKGCFKHFLKYFSKGLHNIREHLHKTGEGPSVVEGMSTKASAMETSTWALVPL